MQGYHKTWNPVETLKLTIYTKKNLEFEKFKKYLEFLTKITKKPEIKNKFW